MASIEKRGTNSWRLVVEVGYDSKGKRVKRTKTVRVEDQSLLKTTKKLREFLETELHKFKIKVEAGEYIAPQKMTLDQFVQDEWTPKYASKTENLSPLTYRNYISHINAHISPSLGHKHLGEIKTVHLLTFIDSLSKPGARKDGKEGRLSNGTIEYTHRVLKNILERAKEWGLIKVNPIVGVKKPKVNQTKFDFYDETEAQEVIAALDKEPRKWRLFILGSMIGGFRRGELLALEWADVDFKNMILSVNKSISLTVDGHAVEKEPKSKSSIRIVDMPEWYMDELKIHEHEWKKEKLSVGDKWRGGDRQYVFHGGYGKPFYHTTPTEWWNGFIKRHNLKRVRFHDLRHSSATLLIEAGASMKAIQQRLGHSKHQTTADIYAHVTKKVSRETAEKFNKFAPQKARPQFVPNNTK
ncbi:tyrosine-type recombinase/integrase [Paenibacillus larvae]|uniref:tyrosine-type recombinase/integrase n=1 Tax=Paenibacillus larvae TaxID=1464 RepID=UPI0023A922DA|nr:site-specific integrase [Paenibacillus larvae]UYE92056.1 integrase [Paenibacillus phage LunBun]UYE92138.1 integrase [Paenibacillus phage BarryFoster_Benicio]UYL91502.1 integrase [Paenibacillus phage ABAtENZ]UYL91584.1 integrase [Paenibacillus phage AJG77]UYL91666.1 integrase [Paenibacillus phage ApiWellbeing]UYL91748.1 integrase [Paenibacillus phage Bloomfield]UYL91910.1 integrase [Paenibacillus phage Carlos]UYL91993.1 integrase [Paenibacillus phage Dante]UYL92075.1 integrase [Paenibaci